MIVFCYGYTSFAPFSVTDFFIFYTLLLVGKSIIIIIFIIIIIIINIITFLPLTQQSNVY